jgi:hypothetical protein
MWEHSKNFGYESSPRIITLVSMTRGIPAIMAEFVGVTFDRDRPVFRGQPVYDRQG